MISAYAATKITIATIVLVSTGYTSFFIDFWRESIGFTRASSDDKPQNAFLLEPARKEAASPPFRFFRRKHDRRARALDVYAIVLDALGKEVELQLQKLLAQSVEEFGRQGRA